ncbi:hypothetical protein MASR2M18_08350 [Ignavibacteria bacterium]|nr:hypothetical protein [Bacteroidota bacterium]MCZ2133698.1 hypothetical protein [Bacteroidota bacterium]
MTIFSFRALALLATICIATNCDAQTESSELSSQFRFGAGLFGSLYFHSAGFSGLPGVSTCCPYYENGSGLGLGAAAFFQKPLAPAFSLSLWGGASDIVAGFTSIEEKTVIVDNTVQSATIQHILETNIAALYFEMQLSAQFSTLFSGFIGMRGDFFATSSFRQREELVIPETGSFETGTRVRNERSGALPGINRGLISPILGIRFDVPLNAERTMFLLPELSFGLSVTDATGFAPWGVRQIRAGATFGWQFQKDLEFIREK